MTASIVVCVLLHHEPILFLSLSASRHAEFIEAWRRQSQPFDKLRVTSYRQLQTETLPKI